MFKRKGNLLHKVFQKYFFPTIMMAMAMSMSIIIDGIIVGNTLGADNLAAVNLAAPITQYFYAVCSLLGVGGSVVASIAKGKREEEKGNVVFTLSIVFMLFVSILTMTAGILNIDSFVQLLAGSGTLDGYVKDYLSVLLYGCPLLITLPGILYFIRADGNPNLASAVLVIANVVNLSFDLIYIKGFGMDIHGAALATITGYTVGLVIMLSYFFSKNRTFKIIKIPIQYFRVTGEILSTGLPSTLGTGLLMIKILFINNIVLATVGDSGMVAFSVCLSCQSFVSMFISGASQTMMPIVGTLYGDGDITGIKFVAVRALKVVLSAAAVLIILFELFPEGILMIFGVTDSADVAAGIIAIRMFSVSLIGTAFFYTMMYYFQTVQRKTIASIAAIIEGLAVPVIAALTLSQIWGAPGIWISFSVAEIATFMYIYITTKVIEKQSKGNYKGIFLFPVISDSAPVFDSTIENIEEQGIKLSEEIIEFCKANNVTDSRAMQVGIGVEEMTMNTIKYGYRKNRKHYIDVNLKIHSEEMILSFKDDGNAFDPTKYPEAKSDGCVYKGIDLIRTISDKLSYDRLLGLNCTVIRFANENS
jgi:Na+-driven multidrug efflux pump/anti-sigma regulatory factor (Ser/Thr protein kinase)